MRIRIRHETNYTFATPAKGLVQSLRVTPRAYDGLYVINWRLDIDQNVRLDAHEDAFGNITHAFSLTGPLESLTVTVDGMVETTDTNGIIAGTLERFPPSLFLRTTALTQSDDAMEAYARKHLSSIDKPDDTLSFLHSLMTGINEDIAFDDSPDALSMSAADAFVSKSGGCEDFAHMFVAMARSSGVPARYVSGHFVPTEGFVTQKTGHAWAEAYVEGLGWIGFDPANALCPIESHVRVAVGLDSLGAAPVRGTSFGGEGERFSVAVQVEQASRMSQ
jgi:transglutaminase-like putative cysteine protease